MCQLLSCSEHGAHAPATMSPKCIDLVDKGNGGGASEAALYRLIQGRSQQLPEIGPVLPHTPAISHQPIVSPTMAASRVLGVGVASWRRWDGSACPAAGARPLGHDAPAGAVPRPHRRAARSAV